MDNRTENIRELEKKLTQANIRMEAACKALQPKHKGGEWEEYHAAHAEQLLAERELAAAKNEEYAVPLDFPYAWDVGAPLPYLLQNDYRTFVTFLLREDDPSWDGTYVNVVDPASTSPHSVAVVEFKQCHATKMGAPNDEVFHGHPLHGKGMEAYEAQEVINSRWLAEVEAINSVHSCYNPDHWKALHHFVLWFHDSTFECAAESFDVETFDKTIPDILTELCNRLVE